MGTPTGNSNYEKNIEDVKNLIKKESLFFGNNYNELYSSRYKETNQPNGLINKEDRILPKYTDS